MRKSVLVLTAALPLALAACGTATPAAAPPATTVTSAAATTDAPAAATTTPVAKSGSACAASDFKADLNAQPDGGIAMLALTNKGTKDCTLRGWAKFSFFAADDSPVAVKTTNVAQPGPGTEIVLKPGRTAFAGFKWTTCDKGDESCHVVTTVRVTPPGTDSPIVADFNGANGGNEKVDELALASAQVGTLQPAAQGVVAW